MLKRTVLLLAFSLLCTVCQAAAGQSTEEKPVVVAFQLERLGGFLVATGNYPYEPLRRPGRSINKE